MENVLRKIYDVILNEKDSKVRLKSNINKLGKKGPDGEYITFLSISNNKTPAYVIKGKGKNITNAINSAIQTYFNKKPSQFKPTSIKLDILSRFSPIKKSTNKFRINKNKITYDRGMDGIAFGDDFHTAFLPGEITGYRIIRKKKLNIKNAFRALHYHLPSTFSKFTKPIDDNTATVAYKFNTKSYYIDDKAFYPLYRNHRIFHELNKGDLWNAIELTKDNYFKNVVNKRGKFIYSYLPFENKKEKRYNILRHAGTIYSMLETYELMPDNQLLEEANRAFKFLFDRIKPLTINGKDVKVVVEKDAQKVGGNALAIVALAKYTKVTGDKQYVPLMQELAAWIQEVQGEDGEFTVHKQQYSTGKRFDFISHYYPGEAILALVRLYQIDKKEEWLDVAEKAANFLINIRDKDDTIDTIAHDHWLLYGLNDLYRERNKSIYIKHSFFIAKAIMKTQITEKNASRKELVGGYVPKSGREPSSTPVACRSEGLSATYQLAKDFGYLEMAQRINYAIKQGIKFQLQMQLRPETVMHYKKKQLCLGAIQSGLKKYSLRIDFTQHNISSFIAYYKILNDE